MGKLIEGQRDPKVVLIEKQEAKSKLIFGKHKRKKIDSLSKAELDELLTAICQRLGIADEAGNLL